MKMKIGNVVIAFLMLLSAGMIASCSSDDDDVQADKTELSATITEAEALLASAVEGGQEGQYLAGSKAVLQTAVDAAKLIAANAGISQTAVDNANVNLKAAIDAFKLKVVAAIAPESLVAHWRFDEGTGTTVADASGNSHNGTLTIGHESLGGPIPSWIADRNGVAGKALLFDDGGHVLVPSHAAFNPQEITIALWVKADHIYSNNYMLAQNSYFGYKFQLQEANKPFFTVNYGPGQYINEDTEKGITSGTDGLPIQEWHHIAVSFKSGELVFYVDGRSVRTITGTGVEHAPTTLANRFDFVIGQELPNANVDPTISWDLPHFEGGLDDIRMYNKALSAAQISQIYDIEKP